MESGGSYLHKKAKREEMENGEHVSEGRREREGERMHTPVVKKRIGVKENR